MCGLDFERDQPPGADALADAVIRIAADRPAFAAAARRRAVARFDLQPWLARHQAVFTELVSQP